MLAEAHQASGDAAASERTLTGLIDESKDADRRARALYQRGELRMASGNGAAAIQDFSQMVKESPEHELAPYALYAMASQQAAANQSQEAEATLRRLLADYKSGPLGQAQFLLANLLQQAGQHDEALRLLDGAEAPDPEKLYLRGMSLVGKQDPAGAGRRSISF